MKKWIDGALPLKDNYPHRLSSLGINLKEYMPAYGKFINEDESKENFILLCLKGRAPGFELLPKVDVQTVCSFQVTLRHTEISYLPLLPSGPDGVCNFLLRRT